MRLVRCAKRRRLKVLFLFIKVVSWPEATICEIPGEATRVSEGGLTRTPAIDEGLNPWCGVIDARVRVPVCYNAFKTKKNQSF